MKNKIFTLLLIISTLIYKEASAQVLCIYCYDQNDSISHGVHNLILNGGFENSNCVPFPGNGRFCPTANAYNCNIANWQCTGGGVNTYAGIFDNANSIIPEGAKAAYFGNLLALPCSPTMDDTACIAHNGCTISGVPFGYPQSSVVGFYGGDTGISLNQNVTGLTIGATYVLEFWAGGENNPHPGIFAVNVGFGNTLLKNPPTPINTGIGIRYIIEFIATATSHTIKFTNWGHICQTCTELVLDDVRLYTLAELDSSVPHWYEGIKAINSINETSIYPNPTGNVLSVKTSDKERLTIVVYDVLSRKLLSQEFTGNADINIERLSRGIYLYQIINDKGIIKNGKIVKE